MRRIAPAAAATALTCACVVVAGCGASTSGARREGPAPQVTRQTPAASPPAIAADPATLARMVREDTGVSAGVRRDLQPCADHGYPVDTASGDLTAGDGPDLVVNVTTCGEGIGIGSYVYRMTGGKYRCVFADERAPVYGSVASGLLEVVHEVYRGDDSTDDSTYPLYPPDPSGQETETYIWRAGHFVQTDRTYTDFGAPTPSASPEPTSTDPVPLPHSKLLDPRQVTGTKATAPTTGRPGR